MRAPWTLRCLAGTGARASGVGQQEGLASEEIAAAATATVAATKWTTMGYADSWYVDRDI